MQSSRRADIHIGIAAAEPRTLTMGLQSGVNHVLVSRSRASGPRPQVGAELKPSEGGNGHDPIRADRNCGLAVAFGNKQLVIAEGETAGSRGLLRCDLVGGGGRCECCRGSAGSATGRHRSDQYNYGDKCYGLEGWRLRHCGSPPGKSRSLCQLPLENSIFCAGACYCQASKQLEIVS